MSARRRAESGPQRGVGFAGHVGHVGHVGHGAHRSERQSAADFRAVMGNFATGVTIITALDVTATDDAGSRGPMPVGFTCQAFTSLSLDPPLISFAVSRSSGSRQRILAAGRFCVNVLAFDQRGLCTRFATRGIDRFAGVDWWPSPGGSPILDRSLAWIDCTVEAEYPGGDHTIIIGRVRELSYLRDAAPMVYHRGEFANCFPAQDPSALSRAS